MNLLALFWASRVGKIVAAIGAALIALGALAWRLKSAGRQQERDRQDHDALENLRTRQDINNDVAGMGDADVRRGLNRWVPDDSERPGL